MRPRRWAGWSLAICALVALAACASWVTNMQTTPPARVFKNPYVVAEDSGERVPGTYFLRRAWVQITRDLTRTEVPVTVPLDLQTLAGRPFAVSWLGHSAMLMRVGGLWVLLDPVLTNTAGPVAGFGPARLTTLPVTLADLPRIDVVLISPGHYDHLDLPTVRHLSLQKGGPPRFMVGQGMAPWFKDNLQVDAQTFDWWQSAVVGKVRFSFVPAQHNSGRSLLNRNTTLWGGWLVEHEVDGVERRFYFAGDTAYVQALFHEIRARFGQIDLAALPIGAYEPRALMRHEHTNPDDAVLAHLDLGTARSFGVHWATFQLGDEEPFQTARDLAKAVRQRDVDSFGLVPIGAVLDVWPAPADGRSTLQQPSEFMPARAR